MKYGQVWQNADGVLVFVVVPIQTSGWFLCIQIDGGLTLGRDTFWVNETDTSWVRCED